MTYQTGRQPGDPLFDGAEELEAALENEGNAWEMVRLLKADNAALRAERDNALTAHDLCKAAADRYGADNAALRQDAERYRWLRKDNNNVAAVEWQDNDGHWAFTAEVSLDEAIDAAIAKDKP